MDDYAPLVQEMQKAGLIKSHRRGCGGRVGPVIGSKVKVGNLTHWLEEAPSN